MSRSASPAGRRSRARRTSAISRCARPAVDVASIGAGGGSIAYVAEATGALRVGPESAGALPGPACYGHGGTAATVTDANVVLGHMPPRLLGGELELDVDAAYAAVARVAEARGTGVEETAHAIVSMVDEAMLGALRVVTVQRGRMPSEFALVAFGGAGGLHANALARILGCYPVIVPGESGVLSALGFISSEIKNEFSQTIVKSIAATTPDAVRQPFEALTARARGWLDDENVDVGDQDVRFILDMRYARQGYEIPIELDGVELAALDLAALEQRFGEAHRRLYGFVLEGGAEIVNLRVVATGRVPLPELEARAENGEGCGAGADRHAGGLDAGGNARRPDLRTGRARAGDGVRRLRDRRAVRRDDGRAPRPSRRRRSVAEPPDPADGGDAMSTTIDVATLDLIENALLNARFEMDEVVRRAAMSPTIRVQHDEFPMICNARGQMVVGQFGSYIPEVIDRFGGEVAEGDVILLNDPYLCKGSISHCNDWLVILPVFFEGRRVAFASLFGHMMDVGGKVPGSQVSDALSIWEEGIRIPPIKIFERGVLNETALDVILNNTRTPDTNRSDLMAIIGGCRAAERRIVEICERFGPETFEASCDALLERTRRAMAHIIRRYIPEEPVTFTDWVDDDGLGNGPFKMVLTIWREGDVCHADWTGTDDQAPGSINFHIHEGLCKLFLGIYMIMAFDPEILFNDGIYDVFEVTLPEGSLLNPKFPAPLSNRLNVHTRLFDCISGALGQKAPELSMAAGYGTSPFFVFSGYDDDGEYFQFVELLFGGLPARYSADGLDGHSWWPLFRTTPAEYAESYYPVRIASYVPARDTGGAGFHRGGTGIEKTYVFTGPGSFTVNDDRATIPPWGINGGRHGGCSTKTLVRASGEVVELPSKIDQVPVGPGRHARLPDRRRRRLGRPARPRLGARAARRPARPRLARGRAARLRRRARRRRRRRGRRRRRSARAARGARADRAVRLRPRPHGRSSMTIEPASTTERAGRRRRPRRTRRPHRADRRAGRRRGALPRRLRAGGASLRPARRRPRRPRRGRRERPAHARRDRSADHRRRRHRLRLGGGRLADDARARGGRRERRADRGSGLAQALRPHGGEGGHPRRGDGAQGARGRRGAALRRDADHRALRCAPGDGARRHDRALQRVRRGRRRPRLRRRAAQRSRSTRRSPSGARPRASRTCRRPAARRRSRRPISRRWATSS